MERRRKADNGIRRILAPRSTLPHDVIRSDADFEGRLITGSFERTPLTRLGAAIIGLFYCVIAMVGIGGAVLAEMTSPFSPRPLGWFIAFGAAAVGFLFGLVGVRMLVSASGTPRRRIR